MALPNAAKSGTFSIGGDLKVNRLGFGAMRITGQGIWGPPADRAEAIRTLKRLRDLGVDFIDTAEAYGPYVSEELIKEALYPYGDLVIATKGGLQRSGPDIWDMNGRPDVLRRGLEGSLKRLGIEQIPLWQLHRIDPKVPRKEQFDVIHEFRKQGLVRHVGLSEVSVADIEEAQNHFQVTTVQNRFSPAARRVGRGRPSIPPASPAGPGRRSPQLACARDATGAPSTRRDFRCATLHRRDGGSPATH